MNKSTAPRRNRGQNPSTDLDTPLEAKPRRIWSYRPNPEAFGVVSEGIARWMGTPQFLIWMTVFCAVWIGWNTLAPENLQFDPKSLNYTLLTLMLSLQASYAAPLLLLADNRQADRDRVQAEEDRRRAEQNLADTEYLTREIASLRIALREVATRDFVRSEIRDLLEDILEDRRETAEAAPEQADRTGQKPGPRTSLMDIVEQSGEPAGRPDGSAPRN